MTKTKVHSDLLACHDCDALHRAKKLPVGQSALCRRCGAILYRGPFVSLDLPLAFSLAGLVFFAMANGYPLLFLELGGRMQESTLFSGVTALFDEGLWGLAILVFCTTLLFPLLNLLGMVYLLLPLKIHHPPLWRSEWVFRKLLALTPWGMTGVYLLGVMVAVVKLRDLASVALGIALYAFAGLLLVSIAANNTLDSRTLWRHMEAKT